MFAELTISLQVAFARRSERSRSHATSTRLLTFVQGQYVDGLRSAFLINNPVEQHTYDDEYIIILGDWYHEQHHTLSKKFLGIYNPTGAEPVPGSSSSSLNSCTLWLIFLHSCRVCSHLRRSQQWYLPSWVQPKLVDPVRGSYFATCCLFARDSSPSQAGKTYRLRVINTGSFAMFFFWIDGHEMRVIEADGTDTEEYAVDHLGITVAQRYSVLVTAKNETNMNYNFHANFDYNMFDSYTEEQVLSASIPDLAGSPQLTRPLRLHRDHLLRRRKPHRCR